MINNKITKKAAVVTFAAVLIVLFKILGLGQFLTLPYVKASQDEFAVLYADHQLMVVAVYMMIYIIVTSLSLPGAAVMTLMGGALFGLGIGTLIVSFASTIGATLACSVSRFLLRDWVQEKFGDKFKEVNEGIAREGSFYLFTLRLIPIFPFWLINLGMGLTRMPLKTIYWVSQVGMLPGTVVYVNAGRELARIESLSGILSPRLIFSFALLGLFPLAVKKAMAFYNLKRKGREHG